MTQQSNNAIDELLAQHGEASQYDEGECFVTEQVVCKSNAGYYVGTWCIESLGTPAQWLPQPNSRDSGYMSEEQAVLLLDSWSA